MSTEIISVIADLALTLSLVVAIIFGVAQVNAVKKDRRERLTLETLRNFQSREFAELILLRLIPSFRIITRNGWYGLIRLERHSLCS